MFKALDYQVNDADAVVGIITGAEDKTFRSGADLPASDMSSPVNAERSIGWTSRHNNIWKPVNCAVNGFTVGGGLHFIADNDIVLAAEHACFFDSHVNVGLVAGLEPVGLVREMPMEAVLQMTLLGRKQKMTAASVLQVVLVGELVPCVELMTRARELAAVLCENAPTAMARTKKAILAAKQQSLDQAMENAWALIIEVQIFKREALRFPNTALQNGNPIHLMINKTYDT